jgi:hypothetical protein
MKKLRRESHPSEPASPGKTRWDKYALPCASLAVFGLTAFFAYKMERMQYEPMVSQATQSVEDHRRAVKKYAASLQKTRKTLRSVEKAYVRNQKTLKRLKADTNPTDFLRAKRMRALYKSGFLEPECAKVKEITSIVGKTKKVLGFPPNRISIEHLYTYVDVLSERHICRKEFSFRTVTEILESWEATPEEKVRVLASLVMGSGGKIFIATGKDHLFLYVQILKDESQKDIEGVKSRLQEFASQELHYEPEIHGKIFGKDYYIVCDPVEQRFPGLIDRKHLMQAHSFSEFEVQDY